MAEVPVPVLEFKAWLEGYEENIVDGAPTERQWRKIRARFGRMWGEIVPPEPSSPPA